MALEIRAQKVFKGAQVWDFLSLRFLWFLCHKVSKGRGLEGWNKKLIFLNVGQMRTILSWLAYAPSTLATIIDFEIEQKKVDSDSPEVHLNVSK
jgi:hypothetical protein